MLTDQGVSFSKRDYFRDRFTANELGTLLASAGLGPIDVLSRRSRAYKEKIGDREAELSDDELLSLMVQDPTLLRRPLVIRGDKVVVGMDEQGLRKLAE